MIKLLKKIHLRKHKELIVISVLVFVEFLVLRRLISHRAAMTFYSNVWIPSDPEEVRSVLYASLFSTFFVSVAVTNLLAFLPRKMGEWLWVFFVVSLLLLDGYRFGREAPFDPKIITLNFALFPFLFRIFSWKVYLSVGLVFALVLGDRFLLKREKSFFVLPKSERAFIRVGIIALALVCGVLQNHDYIFGVDGDRNIGDGSTLYLFYQALNTMNVGPNAKDQQWLQERLKTPYPFYVRRSPSSTKELDKKPNIIFVFMESMPGQLVSKVLPSGKPVTPVLDSLKKQGLSVRDFYSNGIQTSYGYSSAFCGLIPALQKKITTDFEKDSFQCLPSILKKHGYRNVLYYPSEPTFDNTQSFFLKNGFDEIIGIDQRADLAPRCKDTVWFGLRDDCIYERLLNDLDRRFQAHQISEDHPIFTSILTTVTHFDFQYPWNEPFSPLIRDASNLGDRQLNTVALADHYLKKLLAGIESRPYLKDSLIVVVGDHSFPATREQRGSASNANEIGLSNYHVHVPFFLLWPGHVAPQEIVGQAHSQIEIPATILSLLGINEDASFLGKSILERTVAPLVVPVVQPYSGGIIGSISFPYFYRFFLREGVESLSQIESSGVGEHEIAINSVSGELLNALRKETQLIFLNNHLLEENRIFPKM